MPEQQLLEFKPYVWLRAISRSELPKHCRDVLRMLATEMQPGRDNVQITFDRMLELMGMTDNTSLAASLKKAEKAGWLEIERSYRGNTYCARFGQARSRLREDSGHQSAGTLDSRAQDSGNQSAGTLETRAPSYKGVKTRDSSGPDRPREHKKLCLILSSAGYRITDDQAGELYEDIAEHLSDPIAYVRYRLDEGIGDRIHTTGLLLDVLPQDAARDAIPKVVDLDTKEAAKESRTSDETPAAPQSPDHTEYSHPKIWADTLEQLAGRMSRHNFQSWLEPVRARDTADGLVLVCRDEFHCDWLSDQYLGLIQSTAESVAGEPVPIQLTNRGSL